LPFRQKN